VQSTCHGRAAEIPGPGRPPTPRAVSNYGRGLWKPRTGRRARDL